MNPYQHHTDTELVSLIVKGDRLAFETAYRRHVAFLFGYARKNIPIKEDCEEMVQDVFESLWIRREKLEIVSLKYYLLSSIRHMVIRNFYRRGLARKYMEHYLFFEAAWVANETKEVEPEEFRLLLVRGLEGLPPRCKDAIHLRIAENLSNSEIAKRMDVTKETVESYISRAIDHLRTSFPKIYKPG